MEPGSPESVEMLQAMFMLSVFHIFSMREPGEHPSYDFARLMNTAKAWKLFDGDRASDTSSDWHTWVAYEAKKRYPLETHFS